MNGPFGQEHVLRPRRLQTVEGTRLDQEFQACSFRAASSRRVRPGRKCSRKDRFAAALRRSPSTAASPSPLIAPRPNVRSFPSDAEFDIGLVDVGRKDVDPHAARIVDVFGDAVRTLHPARQERRHELGREVGLEIGRLIGDRPVGRRMRLVEAVAGELFDHAEKFGGLGRLQSRTSWTRRETPRGIWRSSPASSC